MKIVSTSFSLGNKKVILKDKYKEIDSLIDKTGIPFVWEEEGDIQDLSKRSANKILKNFNKDKIDFLILVTQSPSDLLPANSTTLSHILKLKQSILTFDINQGCSGFVQSLIIIEQLLKKYKSGLLITADCYRKKLAPTDRSTNSVFSDASAAVLFERDFKHSKILFEDTITDGSKRHLLFHKFSSNKLEYLSMSGSEIWMFTRLKVIPQIRNAIKFCQKNNLLITGIYIHQASKIVVHGIKKSFIEFKSLIHENYMRYGNTVSSSIPILINDFPLNYKNNEVVIFAGFGVGLTSTVLVYGKKL